MNETTHQNGPSETHLCSPNVFHVGSCTDQFDFSLIFEQTALSILPASIYILLGIARAYKLSEARKKARFDLVVLFKVVSSPDFASVDHYTDCTIHVVCGFHSVRITIGSLRIMESKIKLPNRNISTCICHWSSCIGSHMCARSVGA